MIRIFVSGTTYLVKGDTSKCVLPTPNGPVLVVLEDGEWVPIESEYFTQNMEPSDLAKFERVPLADEILFATIC